MYWRYFLWNFVGRQSDIQPTRTQITDGHWLSGIKWIDEKFLAPPDDLPSEIAATQGRHTHYFLPFLLGLPRLHNKLTRAAVAESVCISERAVGYRLKKLCSVAGCDDATALAALLGPWIADKGDNK